MRRTQSKNFESAWASFIREAMVQGRAGRPAGDGWKTVVEFADETGLSRERSQGILADRMRRGALEMQRGKIGRCWVNFYRPKA